MSSSRTQVEGSNSLTLTERYSGSLVLQMALRDIRVLFRTPWIMISRSLAFVISLFAFAYLFRLIVTVPQLDYFQYFAVGSIAATIAGIAFVIGYDIFEEAEEGVLDYLLTLPISRRRFIIGRALGGATRAIIYTIPMFIIVAALEHFSNPVSIGAAMFVLFLLAFGVTGLSITMAVSVRSANRFDVTLALLELAVSRASTALYPLFALPPYVQKLAPYSPVSSAADSARAALLGSPLDLRSLAGLVGFVVIFLGLGSAFYFKRLEGGVYA